MAYKEVILTSPEGVESRALYDTSRQLLIFNYMTTELAKHLGFKWKEVEDGNDD